LLGVDNFSCLNSTVSLTSIEESTHTTQSVYVTTRRRAKEKTYIKPPMMASNTGTPRPILRPMMSLLLTPPVSPSTTPVIPEVGVVVGTKDVGVPLVDARFLTLVPNAMVLATEF
jgi:hypothetical protein